MKQQHALLLGIIGGLALVGIIVLAALGQSVPDVLSGVAIAAVSALAGSAIPAAGGKPAMTTVTLTGDTLAPSPALAGAAPAPEPAPAPKPAVNYGTITPPLNPDAD